MENFHGRNHCILHISLIEGVGPAAVKAIVAGKSPDWDWNSLYHMTAKDLMQQGLSYELATKLILGLQDTRRLDRELQLLESYDISWVTSYDAEYPKLLSEIHLPPLVLYWRGKKLCDDDKKLAIVGSRKANRYGQKAISYLIPDLVGNGWSIVSGGALGADSMAHQETILSGGKTVAVLGSGLLKPYPASNKRLFDEIIAHDGAIISSFPLEMEGLSGNFPARNRIIAGLSRGCIVIQAAQSSGARITAQFALDQGREVFAVPGPIDDALSIGCHELIQTGAKLVHDAEDILNEFNESCIPDEPINCQMVENNSIHENKDGQTSLISLCSDPMTMDDLLKSSGLDLAQLHAQLFEQQIAGKLMQTPNGCWVRRR